MSLTCEICEATEETCGHAVEERLPINYHPAVLCTECCRLLSQSMAISNEFIQYQAMLDYTESLRRNRRSTDEDHCRANSLYCYAVKNAGYLIMKTIREMRGNQ